ncbi:SWIM zinc finger family protein [Methylobacterium sp. NEAU 140]|uniref:SWIM zinc finger family protein n=1 Tax=Methylobacterium sp. NEAU 140 TaxID=3064945 RepID=UPI002734FF8D|nr:SWIM zinc finger family protein [Methylobacterium sp. NEAU 140]MDP4022872.1 SWIM zinc finger family protein [Methylobacterium sp. NEAU 140]
MSLTAEQILALAPDASSRKAGQEQAKRPKWSGLGRAGDLVFGEIKGSGASPYRTVADLSGPAATCTCPSRKLPCKHALGLMLVAAAEALPETAPPDWAAAWAQGREARRETRAAEPDRPADAAARAKRQRARAVRVAGALDEIDLWLSDLMRRGLAAARAEPYAAFDRVAGRLVDGQVPGLARRVRALPGLAAAAPAPGAPRPEAALALAVARIALLVRAARRRALLTPGQAAGVNAALGLPVSAETLAAQPGVADDWAVLAHTAEEEDRLLARSVWLAGRRTGTLAQVIDFGPPGAPLPPVPAPGQDFAGVLAFHPGDPPLRAAFREGRAGPAASAALPGAGTVAAARDAFAAVLARAPWTERWPVALAGARLGRLADGSAFAAGDATGCLPLRAGPHLPALLAVAAGRPADLFGLFDGTGLAPLALSADGHLYAVPPHEARPVVVRAA